MAHLAWSVMCAKAITDKDTNSLSLIDALEELTIVSDAPNQPQTELAALSLNSTLASMWCRDEPETGETLMARVQVMFPNGKSQTIMEYKVDLETNERIRILGRIGKLPILGPGIHSVVVQHQSKTKTGKVRWITDSKTPLNIKFVERSQIETV